ncbi:CHC2 zinc finger domain-containing protein [Sphingomonas sp. KR1UV-12]|uniref:CHC2 zinc finger domain-containing protein n=1 Tax=Sphingomonas aurea TaxID=3063994 RepID=A0ABT9EHI3_9SPHN|nr:CHC2 zinc finger domain-containing protein [Sphingomonas sp. KR1UV-12]MDP1026302.1 CHC2 zinc finger domain-containing protein [Sphingomonas sp. KR1UV-12]
MARMDSAELARVVAGIRDRFPLSGVASKAGVKLHRAGNELKACCPLHADRTPSFTIFNDDRRFQCFGCGEGGDVLDLVMKLYGVKLPGAIEMLDGGALRELEQQRAPAKPKADMRPIAQRIVNASVPIEGTPAEVYLRSRGITMALPHTLRFARLAPPQIEGNGVLAANGPGLLPALIAIVTDAGGQLVGLQRTYLTEAGRKAGVKATDSDRKPKVKYSLGNVIGGSIQLGPASSSMVVTEGLEDGLTLAQALGRSVWVAAGTSMMPQMAFAPITRAVVIGADGDEAGEAAAMKAAAAYGEAGLGVRIMRPTRPFKDYNAELMGVRP